MTLFESLSDIVPSIFEGRGNRAENIVFIACCWQHVVKLVTRLQPGGKIPASYEYVEFL
jgi:hypothetical protein